MSVTILEVLQNAKYNIKQEFARESGIRQLHNAIVLLEKGYSVFGDFNEIILSGMGDIDSVPECENEEVETATVIQEIGTVEQGATITGMKIGRLG